MIKTDLTPLVFWLWFFWIISFWNVLLGNKNQKHSKFINLWFLSDAWISGYDIQNQILFSLNWFKHRKYHLPSETCKLLWKTKVVNIHKEFLLFLNKPTYHFHQGRIVSEIFEKATKISFYFSMLVKDRRECYDVREFP